MKALDFAQALILGTAGLGCGKNLNFAWYD